MCRWNQKGICAVLAGAGALVGVTVASPSAALSTPGQKCAAAKMEAAATTAKRQLHCYANAMLKGTPVDQNCLTNAAASLARTFQKAEAKSGCATVDDAAAVQSTVDTFVSSILRALPSVPPTATPTSTATATASSTMTSTATLTPTATQTPSPTAASCTTSGDCVSGFCCSGAPGTCVDSTLAASCGAACADCTSAANDRACVSSACGCTADTDCDGTHSCDVSAHMCKLANGQTCASGSDCTSGNCVGSLCAP